MRKKELTVSLNIFTCNSSGKSNFVELVVDDQQIIYTTTDEKVIQLLGIKHNHKPSKGPGNSL